MDLNLLAEQSTKIREAAECASAIADNLHKINNGLVLGSDSDRSIERVNIWFDRLAEFLGKKGETA